MGDSIIDVSRHFFFEVVRPILETHFPQETERTAFGVFGYGSEALGLDDDYSRDHHWGLRIDALMPEEVFLQRRQSMMEVLTAHLPPAYQGHSLRQAHLSGAGLAPDNLPAFLQRTIGLDRAPQSHREWLSIPEEDILHLINGEVWLDPTGEFTGIRQLLQGYYPEPVRLRRIAHWCRFFSGMGVYALKRAILRNNGYYATITFSRALRWGVQLAFLLERTYFPYDKWTLAYVERLPRLGAALLALVTEAVDLNTDWSQKLKLLHDLSDLLDRTLVADGIIRPHPPFAPSPTSGYRLLEHAYAEIIQGLPTELQTVVPVWDQIYMEEFHSGFVAGLDMERWDEMLQLKTRGTGD